MSIIYANDTDNHDIKKYSFLLVDGESENLVEVHESEVNVVNKEPLPIPVQDDSKVVELLNKVDELSSNIIKLQMKMEERQKEFDSLLEETKMASFEKGKQEGETKIKELLESSTNELQEKLLTSIETILAQSKKVEDWIEESKKEIPLIAFDIANEVVKKEVTSNAKEVAYSLALSLLEDVKESKNIKIKLHPKDFVYVKEQFSEQKNLTFEKDAAIARGGVVIFSDYGNIDGNLKIRLLKAKELLES